MPHGLRAGVAWFDALAMGAFAYVTSNGRVDDVSANLLLWGPALAAAIVALVVLRDAPAVIGWVAIGYILFAALLVGPEPRLLLVALAVALMPVTQRPRGLLALGIVVATVSAFAFRLALQLVA